MIDRTRSSGSEATFPSPRSLDPRFAVYRKTGDRRLRNELIVDHRWLAVHCIRRFVHKREPHDDLIQVAHLGLLNAIERFDPACNVAFTTFAMPTIRGELLRYFRDKTWSLHVPRRPKENYLLVTDVAEELVNILGRSPTVPEIAQRANLSAEHTLEALEVGKCYRGVPLDPPSDEEARELPVGDRDPGYDQVDAGLVVRYLLDDLSNDRDRLIITLRFFHGMTQSQIATRIGVSQVQVSRLLRATLERMRDSLIAKPQPAA